MYEDINNDGTIDIFDVLYLGDSNPDFFGGFNNRFKLWKNLDIAVVMSYSFGSDVKIQKEFVRLDKERICAVAFVPMVDKKM